MRNATPGRLAGTALMAVLLLLATHPTGAEPPADGFYRCAPDKGAAPPQTPLLGEPLALHVDQALLTSNDNQNTEFSLQLRVPYDAALTPLHSLALAVGGHIHVASGSGSSGTTWSHPYFALHGRAQADAVARHLGIEPRLRHHPGQRLQVAFVPEHPVFAPGEAVAATFRLTNVGDAPVAFVHGGRNRAPRDNQYDFLARLAGQLVPDIGTSLHFGGLSQRRVLKPGETFEERVDLKKWFAFGEPGFYEIVGTYALALLDPVTDDHVALWEDFATASFRVEVAPPSDARTQR